jgi:uncharacterized protein (TIGR03437 family)
MNGVFPRLSGGVLAMTKRLAQSTEQVSSPSAQVLGGQQFGTSFADFPVAEGCTAVFSYASAKAAACPIDASCSGASCVPVACIPQACLAPGVTPADLASQGYAQYGQVPGKYLTSPEQAAYNVLRNYFDGTPAAASFGGTPGTGLENFLQIYDNDFLYATAHINALAPVVETGGTIVSMAAQDILTLASQKLLAIAEDGPVITSVSNAFFPGAPIAPNTWVSIQGKNLAPVGFDRIWGLLDFVDNKLPTQLSGVSVTVNGKNAFVFYISPSQINILTPPDAMSGPVQVLVTNDGQTSAAFTVQAQLLSPSFFAFNGGPYVAATHVNGSLLGPASLYPGATTPAKPGETVVLYANGFGTTSTPVVSGSIQQSGTLSPPPVLKIAGLAATVAFAGLVSPGEFQFNVVVPANTPAGDQPITATHNGLPTQSGTLITIQ